jgi:probable HAF family extracellular repeat protein
MSSAVNADGAVIVGTLIRSSPYTPTAFRWTIGQGMQNLGFLPGGSWSYAWAVSADGSVVAGNSGTAGGAAAFLWTAQSGMVELNGYLASLGVDLTGWSLQTIRGVSADGSSVAGAGTFGGQQRAFVVRGLPSCGYAMLAHAAPLIVCSTASANMAVVPFGTPPFSYQWQVRSSPGVGNGGDWVTIANDPAPLACGGSATAFASPTNAASVRVGIRPCPGDQMAPQRFQIRCILTNSCGSLASEEGTYSICPADFNCSSSLEVQDIFDFLNAWLASDPRANFNGAGGLNTQDIFDYLNAWFAGC